MINDEIILEPDPSRVMEGLRDTGYNFNTAIADLIDNSIAANAHRVKIKIVMSPKGNVNVYLASRETMMSGSISVISMTVGIKM